MSNWRKLAIPLTVLLVPFVILFALKFGKNHFKRLPILGPITISQSGDTLYHTVPAFSFINQEGKRISSEDLKDKIYVANFFFSTCKTVCPKMNENVGRIQYAFKDNPDIRILTFSVDPQNDSVAALAAYAEKMRADNNKWWFLTGNKDSIYTIARDGFLVPAAEGKTAGDFFHSQDLILIDKQNRIRAVYDGTEKYEVDTLIDEINVLLQEYVESN